MYVEDGHVKGFLALSSEAEIIGLYVTTKAQRTGLGSSLMAHAKDINPCLSMRVFKQNDPAVKFLFNRGFLIGQETPDEYVMQWCDKDQTACKVGDREKP